jgi:hypothetical protein
MRERTPACITSRAAKLLFDTEELVVFSHAVRPRRRAGLNLPRVDSHHLPFTDVIVSMTVISSR